MSLCMFEAEVQKFHTPVRETTNDIHAHISYLTVIIHSVLVNLSDVSNTCLNYSHREMAECQTSSRPQWDMINLYLKKNWCYIVTAREQSINVVVEWVLKTNVCLISTWFEPQLGCITFFMGPFRISVIVLSCFASNHICHHWPGGMLGQK